MHAPPLFANMIEAQRALNALSPCIIWALAMLFFIPTWANAGAKPNPINERLNKWYSTNSNDKTQWPLMATNEDYTTRTAIALLHVLTPSEANRTQGLNVEPLCDCPDFTQINSKTFRIIELSSHQAQVVVSLQFSNGENRALTLHLVQSKKLWQIDNIQSDRGFDLREVALGNQVVSPPTGVVNAHSTQIVKQLQSWYDLYRVGQFELFSNAKAYFTQSTSAQILRVQKITPKGEMSLIHGSNPLTESQDPSALEDVRFHVLSASNQRAEVKAKIFYGNNSSTTVKLQLKHEKNGWRIHNIVGSDGANFRKQIQMALKEFSDSQ